MKTFLKTQIRIILVFFTAFGLYAQSPGSLDTSFDIGEGFYLNYGHISSLALQADGKILVGGRFSLNEQNGNDNNLARLNEDGTLDTSLNSGSGFNSGIDTTVEQPDGKILVGGSFTSYKGQTRNKIVRLNTNGSIDTSFSIGTGFSITSPKHRVSAITLQPDGKILVGGCFSSYNGQPVSNIIRLNSDGSIDTSFNTGEGIKMFFSSIEIPAEVHDIKIQSDGKIIIAGQFSKYDGQDVTRNVIRLNEDGSLDASLNITTGIGLNGTVFSIAIQEDNKIIVGGINFLPFNNLTRFNGDGSLDTTFNIPTGFEYYPVSDIVIQPDGKILVGGSFIALNDQPIGRITRLNSDGSIDTSFNVGGGFDKEVSALLLQLDGKIIVGGEFNLYNGQIQQKIARLDTDGNTDGSFIPFNIQDNYPAIVRDFIIQPDGKIIIVGSFTGYNGQVANNIIRLNPDGSIDTSFLSGTGFYKFNGESIIYKIATQSDEKILISGSFSSYNEQPANKIIRLNPDGSLETAFDPESDSVPAASITTFDIQPDGKIIVGGEFFPYIARYNADGSLDTSFNIGAGLNGTVYTIVVQPDGKTLVGGEFTQFDGQTHNKILRLNPDGSLDSTFNTGSGLQSVNHIAITLLPDGKILVGTILLSYNGQALINKRIIRLNNDGSLDTSFEEITQPGGTGSVKVVTVQPDGKIILGGKLVVFGNGYSQRNIVRLNSDGSFDPSFQVGTGFNDLGEVNAIVIQPDSKIVVGGKFVNFNGYDQKGIVRLHGDTSAGIEELKPVTINTYPNPTTDYFNITSETVIQSVELYDVSGRLVRTSLVNDFESKQNISNLDNGVYILKIKTEQGEITGKIVKK